MIGRLDGFSFAPENASRRLGRQGVAGRGAQRAGRRDRRARDQGGAGARARVRAVLRRRAALDRAPRSPSSLPATTCCARGCGCIADEQLTGPSRETVQARLELWLKTHIERMFGAAVRARRRGRRHRHQPRHRLPADRGARRAGAPARRRRRQGPRPGGARHAAQVRPALRRLSPLPADAAQAGAAQSRRAALGAEARTARRSRVSTNCSGSPPAAAPRSRSTRRRRRRSIAPSATGCAASVRSASISWSGSPT